LPGSARLSLKLSDFVRQSQRYSRGEASDVGQSYFAPAENDLNAGILPEAADYIARSVAILRSVLDDDNPILANSLSMQGQIYEAQKKPAEARDSLIQAIAAFRKAYKAPHYLIGIAEVYLGLVDSELGNTPAALADLDDAKRNYDASYRHLHVNHGDLLIYRAMILKRAHRMAEARPLLQSTSTISRLASSRTASDLLNLAPLMRLSKTSMS